eukprot:CAMPEP_0180823620 /NCGR_PEP_ID=MMETSP1038_2-20121128/72002_1 /TAXON_ID=632150 /ORGANISM="Azadinium spinosum, Strain 3D9" /LENGTH=41 /DNA_ID= /DNA_START= /DNA_END= /DNA_ORIENTATION=
MALCLTTGEGSSKQMLTAVKTCWSPVSATSARASTAAHLTR